jgi:hypothetical protein
MNSNQDTTPGAPNIQLSHLREVGGRDRDRTGDPLLAKIGRTRNRPLTWSAMERY